MNKLEIRAWNQVTKTMLTPFKLQDISTSNYAGDSWLWLGENELVDIKLSDLVFMYSTGRQDKNGKKIFEVDINQDGGTVIWNEDDASFCWEYKDIETQPMGEEEDWCEIVSNIYEQ